MSVETVKLVGDLQPPPESDLAALFRDDKSAGLFIEAATPLFDPGVETRLHNADGAPTAKAGLEGFRQAWLELLEPWEGYRSDIKELIDLGDSVLAVTNDHGRRKGAEIEERVQGAAIWTVQGGKVTAVDFYADRTEAFKEAVARRG